VARIVLTAFESRTDAVALANTVVDVLRADGHDADLHHLSEDFSVHPESPDSLIVSLGGDGTFLRAARLAHSSTCAVMGVNLGRVGFLLPVEPGQIYSAIENALSDQRRTEQRVALRVTSPDCQFDSFALNEVVLERSLPGHMVRVQTFIDGDEFLTYSADGVLVSTPTGSTGYNFSAGGPVVSQELSVMVLTPIAPHFTIDRSIVVGSHQEIVMRTLDRGAAIVTDGSHAGSIESGESVVITRDPVGVTVVLPQQSGIGSRLRASLREGHA
jgi:NAD+ kinase